MSRKADELILCVPTRILERFGWARHGITGARENWIAEIAQDYGQFLRRGDVEDDPAYRQVIPYDVTTSQGRYFVFRRNGKTTEGRLRGRMSLGIGGHLTEDDTAHRRVADWNGREWDEEVESCAGYADSEFVGLLTNNADAVGRVHVGLLALYTIDEPRIVLAQHEANEAAEWLTLPELQARRGEFEGWSQIVIDWLAEREQAG